MASRNAESTPVIEEPTVKFPPAAAPAAPAGALQSITESLALLGLTPEALALSVGESLAERYLAALRTPRPPSPLPLLPCGAPHRATPSEPNLQLFSNDFINYLNQIA